MVIPPQDDFRPGREARFDELVRQMPLRKPSTGMRECTGLNSLTARIVLGEALVKYLEVCFTDYVREPAFLALHFVRLNGIGRHAD